MSKSKKSSSSSSSDSTSIASSSDSTSYFSSYNKRSSYYAVLCAINFAIFFIYGTSNINTIINTNTNTNMTRLCEKMLIITYMCNKVMWW